jgi:hypothetical protein
VGGVGVWGCGDVGVWGCGGVGVWGCGEMNGGELRRMHTIEAFYACISVWTIRLSTSYGLTEGH